MIIIAGYTIGTMFTLGAVARTCLKTRPRFPASA